MTEENNNEEAQEIIEESGHPFHCEAVKHLRNKEWDVTISPYYSDNVTGKSREVDIIAEKYFFRDRSEYSINPRLFIECKKGTSEAVFWFDDIEYKKPYHLIEKDTPLTKDNTYINTHHYGGRKKVAKLFDSTPKRDNKNDPFYKALNQSLNAFIYFREKDFFTEEAAEKEEIIAKKELDKYDLNYPLILLKNFENLYGIDVNSSEQNPDSLADETNFLLEINYSYLDKNNEGQYEYFLIDVVNFRKIDKFFTNKLVGSDIRAIDKILS